MPREFEGKQLEERERESVFDELTTELESVKETKCYTIEVVEHEKPRKMKFNAVTRIKRTNQHTTPFHGSFRSFNIAAIVLSFFGNRREVCRMLQLLNHTGRAYIIQQNGLPGFLEPEEIMYELRKLMSLGKLDDMLRPYSINDSEAFMRTMSGLDDRTAREAFLKQTYPILYIDLLKAQSRQEDLKEFCKRLRDNHELFTFYIQHYLLAWFESLRRGGRLTKGITAHFK